MVPYAADFRAFISLKRLNIKLLCPLCATPSPPPHQHPRSAIVALSEKRDRNDLSSPQEWQRVARVYLDQQRTAAIFSAHMRFEGPPLFSPEQTLQRVLADLLSHQQMYTSADSLPALNATSMAALSSVLHVQQQPMGNYEHSMYVNATYGAAELRSA